MILYNITGSLVHQILKDVRYVRDRNGVAHSFHLCGSKLRGVDAYYFAVHIQKGAAAVAGIDGRVCLDQVHTVRIFVRLAVIIQLTVLGADDTGSY